LIPIFIEDDVNVHAAQNGQTVDEVTSIKPGEIVKPLSEFD
jgi:hypothetical protein